MENLYVLKIGGNIIDNEATLHGVLKKFAAIDGAKILVHGGGKLATSLAADLAIPQQMVEGRRITDAATLKVVTMVYAGYINKTIVAQLQAAGANAIGLSGADGDCIRAHKRIGAATDYGFVGDVDAVNKNLLQTLLEQKNTIVLCPITHDGSGQLLNTNADTIAQSVATALSTTFDVQLIYAFEKRGVLHNADDDTSLIPKIDPQLYEQLKKDNIIFAGMLPKLQNAFAALNAGVQKVIIGKGEELDALLNGTSGTTIVNE